MITVASPLVERTARGPEVVDEFGMARFYEKYRCDAYCKDVPCRLDKGISM